MIRKVILTSPMVALIPIVHAATPIKDEPTGLKKPEPMKASELPIYEAPHSQYVELLNDQKSNEKKSYLRSTLSEPVSVVRQQVQQVWQQTEQVTDTVSNHYNEFKDRSSWIVKYLREEENKQQRYGAVVMGGLTGFIFGLRGGFFKRFLYTTAGTTTMGFICFPEETKLICRDVSTQAKHYINVGYNFCYGVKPGDPQMEVKFPELTLPKSFSEFVDMTTSMASSIKTAVMPPPKQAELPKSDK